MNEGTGTAAFHFAQSQGGVMTRFHVRYSAAFSADTAEEAVEQFRAMVAEDRGANYFVTNYETRLSRHFGPPKQEVEDA